MLALPRLVPQPYSSTELPWAPDCPGQFPRLLHTRPWLPSLSAFCLGYKGQRFLHQCLFILRQATTQWWENERSQKGKMSCQEPWASWKHSLESIHWVFQPRVCNFPPRPHSVPRKQVGALWTFRHNTEPSTIRYQLPHMPLCRQLSLQPSTEIH